MKYEGITPEIIENTHHDYGDVQLDGHAASWQQPLVPVEAGTAVSVAPSFRAASAGPKPGATTAHCPELLGHCS